MVGTFLIPFNTPTKNENHDISILENFYSDETKSMVTKEEPPVNSIDTVQVAGVGSHRVLFHYYKAHIPDDHDDGAAGAGEWHFHVEKPHDGGYHSGNWIPNAPYDESITFKVDGSGNVGLDDRWSGSEWVGGNVYGLYGIYTCAWEEDGWPLPKVDSASISNGDFDVEIQGNYYSGWGNDIPGHLEVNRWIYLEDMWMVSHYLKYYVENEAPAASSISPQNPTIFAGDTITLTGTGSDPEGDRIVYEWDLDYDGVNFHVNATGKSINASFIEGEHLVAYRVKDCFYGAYTPASNIETTLVTANPSDAPFIDQPADVTYVWNTTGHNITWQPTDDNPRDYFVTRTNSTSINDTQIIMGPSVWNNESITLDIDGYPLGRYYFTCNVSDNSNHASYSTVSVDVIEVDKPTIEQSPENITYIEGASGNIITWNTTDENPARYTITRNESIFEVGTWNGSVFTTNVDSLSAGTHIFNCTFFDQFGNSVCDIVQVVVLDIVSPEIFLTTLINGTTHQSGTPINVTIQEKYLDTVFYNWDGSSNQSTSEGSFQTLLPTTDSPHVLVVYAYDRSGNWGTNQFIFITDDTPPTISFYSPSDGATYESNEIDVAFIGDEDFDSVWYYISVIDTDNITWASVTKRTLDDGTYTIHGFASDTAGNIAHVSVSFTIDTTSTTTTTTTAAPSSFPGFFTVLLFFVTLVVITRRHK